jgi:endonuclease/exonuclease/phosphatase family metal-dependent hydrolase
VALVLSFLASYFNPASFWPFWFAAAIFPVLLCWMVFLQVYWLVVLRWPVLIPLLTLAVCYVQINKVVQFRLPSDAMLSQNSITVMSYNVHLFDWYNWRNPWQKHKQILEQIKGATPDILCVQEFFHSPKDGFITLDSIQSQNGLKHFYFEKYVLKRKFTGYGMVIFSKWPILNKGKFNFDNTRGNSAIFADILFRNDTIRVYNLHLESNRFKPEDYAVMKELGEGDAETENTNGLKRIIRRLKVACKARGSQADTVANHIAKCPYPVLVCGDFNDAPSSYTYHKLSNGLVDSFLEKGIGIGQTYIGSAPAFRIDYILHSPNFSANSFETHPEELSDHHAVSSRLQIKM